jgi:hypothetical protein
LYFFAFRPAYKRRGENEKSDQVGRFPAVFVVEAKHLGPPYHVYPFDTGAAAKGIFGDVPNPDIFLEDYELDSSFDSVLNHIEWAFGTSSNYYEAKVRPTILGGVPHFDEVAKSYVDITRLASRGHNEPDRRASSIEIALNRHVPVEGNVRLAILPKQYLEDGPHSNREMLSHLRAQGVAWRVYNWQPFSRPIDHQDALTTITKEYLIEERYIDA